MKRFIIGNVILLFAVLCFYQFNGSIFSSIYFSPVQSFFTRLDYLFMGLFFGSVFYLLLILVSRISIRIEKKKLRDLIHNELNFVLLISLVSCLVYGYSVMYPNMFFSNMTVGYIEVGNVYIGVLYIVELIPIVILGKKWNKGFRIS